MNSQVLRKTIDLSRQLGPNAQQVLRENLRKIPQGFLDTAAVTDLVVCGEVQDAAKVLRDFEDRWLRHPEPTVRRAGISALSELEGGVVLPLLAKALTNPAEDAGVRGRALLVLILYVKVEDVEDFPGGSDLFSAAMDLMARGPSDYAHAVARSLEPRFRTTPPQRHVDLVLSALNHEDYDVRLAAVAALGHLAGSKPEVFEEMARRLDTDADGDVVEALSRTLRETAH